MQQITVKVHTYGRFAKYGPNVWKVGEGQEEDLLQRAGWQTVRGTSSYRYMRPPAAFVMQGRDVPVVTAVPARDELRAFALDLHARPAVARPGVRHAGVVPSRPERRAA
jgi:hypothetical protein